MDSPKPRTSSDWATLKTLLPYLWPTAKPQLKLRVVLAVLCLILAKSFNVYVPFLYKRAIDALGQAGALAGNAATAKEVAWAAVPIFLVVAYGVSRILHQTFAELRDVLFSRVAHDAQRRIGLGTFEHLHRLSLRFHLEKRTGGLSRTIERGTSGIESLLLFAAFNIIPTILEIAMVTVILFVKYDVAISIIIGATIIIYILFTLSATLWRLKYRKEMNELDSEANSKAVDSLLNYETVKYFGNEALESARFGESTQAYANAAVKNQATLGMLNFGQSSIIGVGLVCVMLASAKGVVSHRMTVGDFVMVNTFLIQLYLPLGFLGFVFREIKQGLVNLEKMFDLLNINAEIQDLPNAPALKVRAAAIRFKNVGFSYEPDRQILRDISFDVPGGNTVAIVGPSGSGKSTIARLLFRFYDVNSGTIEIDGQDIRNVSQSSLRAITGIVPQDTVLFNDTVYYNIVYGRPESTREEVIAAAKVARIHDFVASLPKGYESLVGERGLKLSGGEKQRVAIARTVLKNPSVLIFDEATSALDSHTEREIQTSIDELSKNRTTLVIAHRLSTVVDADEILVLSRGEIIERGKHASLLAQGGVYKSMWTKQQDGT